ncbi:unnamed protein product [Calypogeia fissa]
MATMRGVEVFLCVVMALCSLAAYVGAQPYAVTDWTSGAHATFYGGEDASGTMEGACGYGNLYEQGYGTNTAALSSALFNNGLSCGACFALQCETSQTNWCYGNDVLYVTATNYCPQGSFGGWCDYPKVHFDLAYPAFSQLARAVGGVIPIQYRRVPCFKDGGIRFTVGGNPWYLSVVVTNVGGAGDIQSLAVKGSNTGSFESMYHNWGQVWTLGTQFVGQSLSFQATVGEGSFQKTWTFWDAVPSYWAFGQTYEYEYNFVW